jgi:hypothetical protein
MALRDLHTDIKSALIENTPLNVFHLVKFEKPSNLEIESAKAEDYVYLTDAFHDVEYLGNTYTAGGLLKIGKVQETTEAKASNINLEVSATKLGVSSIVYVSSSTLGTTCTLTIDIDLFKSGFYPGDTVKFISRTNSLDYYVARLDKLYSNGTKVDITLIETYENNEKIYPVVPRIASLASYRVEYASPEVQSIVSSSSDSLNYSNYVNRTVEIFRVYSNTSTGVRIGEPVTLFKGVISKGTLREKSDGASIVSWNIVSHWGDFVRVQGRLTSDDFHRALDSSGRPDAAAVLRPEYIYDKGFEHADTALNVTATYTDISTSIKFVKRGGLLGGFATSFMGKKPVEQKYEVERELDLSINLSGKFLPVVYGVQKIDAIPVFADVVIEEDTDTTDLIAAGNTDLYMANALCEGPIGGIYDIFVENKGLICKDDADASVRQGSYDGIPCLGRMSQGTVLGGSYKYDLSTINDDFYYTNPREDVTDFLVDRLGVYEANQYAGMYDPHWSINQNFEYAKTSDTGILHNETFQWPEAGNILLTLHAGTFNQTADPTLLNLAAEEKFKVQQDYYAGNKLEYWSANHRLMDTAYVVTRDTIAAEDGQARSLSYVVKGKFINCYNYDGTYKAITGYTTFELLNLGDQVTVTLADGSTSSAEIVDKFTFYDGFGAKDRRIKVKALDSSVDDKILSGNAGRITLTKDSINWIMQADNYTGDDNSPINVLQEYDFNGLATDFVSSINTTLKRTITESNEEVCRDGDYGSEICSFEDLTRYEFELDISGISSYAKNLIKTFVDIEETSNYLDAYILDFSITHNGVTRTEKLHPKLINTSTWKVKTRSYNGPFSSFFSFAYQSGVTQTLNVSVEFNSRYAVIQNTDDVLDPSTVSGVVLSTYEEDSPTLTRTLLVPEDSVLRAFIASNNILILNSALPYTTNSKYFYGIKESIAENVIYGDYRVSTNPALQLLDYLTSKRYGKGLDFSLIDLNSFKETARACDTGSDISILSNITLSSINVGDIYKYPETGPIIFRGTVESARNVLGYTEITFTDVIGKLGRKWEATREYAVDTLVWALDDSNNTKFGTVVTAGTVAKPSAIGTSPSLTKVSGTGASTILVDTAEASPEGNPFIKLINDRNDLVSGYSLYDCDEVKYWKYLGWDEKEQRNATRHQTNIVIDTSSPVFDNVNGMLSQFNGILRYNNGTYSLSLKTKAKALENFDESIEIITTNEIVGDIKLEDKGISKTYNAITASIIDPMNDFNTRNLSFFNSTYLKQDKNVQRQGNYKAGGISNYFNARLNIKQALDESRAGLTVSFTVAPKGYLLLSGEIIAITYPRFNWETKLFRISSLNVRDDLMVDVVALEHADNAYLLDRVPSSVFVKYSNIDTTRPRLVPVAPTALNIGGVTRGGIQLSWTQASNFNISTHTVEIWRSPDTLFENAIEVGRSKSSVFTDTIASTEDKVYYYWIRYALFQDNVATNSGKPQEIFSNYYPSTAGTGVAGTFEVPKDTLAVQIISNDSGFVFKNNTGTPKTLTAIVYDGVSVVNSGISYHWKIDDTTVLLDGSNNLDMTSGTIPANGTAFTSIVVGPEDIENGGSNLITCEVTVD